MGIWGDAYFRGITNRREDLDLKLSRRQKVSLVGCLVLAGVAILVITQVNVSPVEAVGASPSAEKTIRYIRERFAIPDSQNLTLGPFQEAAYPGYYQATMTVDEGKEKKLQKISVSANSRYLILSDFVPLGSDTQAELTRRIAEIFKVPAGVKLSVGPFINSPYPGFLQTTLTANDGKRDQKQNYFVTRDKHYFVLGTIYNMDVEPRRLALQTIKLEDQPSQGPANAPVTIVEYADLECPTCAREHAFMQEELLPRYGGKLRIIYKEFPLQGHPWSMTAAIANQCAYQLDPSKYVAYRSSIFEHQQSITLTSARDLLLYYGQQVGLDKLKLAACVDSKASLPRVEANLHEAQKLEVDRTPTFFINGRKLIGGPPDQFIELIDEALRASR